MTRSARYGLVAVVGVLSGCGEARGVVDPVDDRRNWNWDAPMATIWGGGAPTLICSPLTVSFNGTVSCYLANSGPMNVPTWSFEADGGLVRSGPLGIGNWSGPLVVSGDVVVRYADEYGSPAIQTATIGVTRRNWSWVSVVGGRQGTLGEIDGCFSTVQVWEGLTAARDCTAATIADFFTPRVVSSGNGYTATQVPGTGPNGGWWYVTSPSAVMDLRSQVRRDYRTDGTMFSVASPAAVASGCANAFPQFPTAPRSMHTVNTYCIPTAAFANLVGCIWSHETAHVTAGTTAAQASANDVYRLWEPLVQNSAAALQTVVANRYTVAEDSVSRPAIAAHDPPFMQLRSFSVWYNAGFGWGGGTTVREVYC